MANNSNFLVDTALQLEDGAAARTASGAGTIATVAKVVDLGTGYVQGEVIFDVGAVELTTDEVYYLNVELSSAADFSSGKVVACTLPLGKVGVAGSALLNASAAVSETASKRFRLKFHNEFLGTQYRYMRCAHVMNNGTAETITYTAWATLQR
jgi:hypothetical protein